MSNFYGSNQANKYGYRGIIQLISHIIRFRRLNRRNIMRLLGRLIHDMLKKNMKKHSVTKHLVIIAATLVLGTFANLWATDSSSNGIISTIPEKGMEYGCGCTYVLKPVNPQKYQFIFLSDFMFEKPKMRIYGKTVTIKPVNVEQIPKDAKVGETFTQTYQYGSVAFLFENKVIFVCPEADESCEVTTFDSVLTVKDGSKKKVYQVQGDCGC